MNAHIAQTQALNIESFIVRQQWEIVEKYRDANRWNALGDLHMKELMDHIAPLMWGVNEDEFAKRFDAMLSEPQLNVLNGFQSKGNIIPKIVSISHRLQKKASIPAVAHRMEMLKLAADTAYWDIVNIAGIERMRIELRKIVKYFDPEQQPIHYTTFEDKYDGHAKEHQLIYNFNNLEAYRKKVEQYLLQNSNNLIISKLRTMFPSPRQS